MSASIRRNQLVEIHVIRRQTRLDEASYRGRLAGFGATSSKYLSAADADRLLSRMRDIPGASKPVERRTATASGPYAKSLQRLWITLFNLGEVRNRTDAAMHRWLHGQTKIAHTRFLLDDRDARRAVEGLKKWTERAGVIWPARTGDPQADRMAGKRAVLRAQWRRGIALGAVTAPIGLDPETYGLVPYVAAVTRGMPRAIGSLDCPSLTPAELDKASAALGAKLRKAAPARAGG